MKTPSTKHLVLAALFAALTAIFSQLSIPIEPVPINLALLGVLLCGGLLPLRWAALSMGVYILLGAVGLPVFSGFSGGVGVLVGPRGGYIAGYLLCAVAVAALGKVWRNSLWKLLLVMALGVLSCYTLGTLWFMNVRGMGLAESLSMCVLPFLPGDAAKAAAAALLTSRLLPLAEKELTRR